jgi:hypothetical protein
MSETASFGNIVNTLLTVRENYHQELKSIPQYEAFLLIESSTEKAAGVLQDGATSSAAIATDVIDSLQFARNRFEQHMTCIPEYRVLAAIDKLIKEVSADLGADGHAAPGSNEGPGTTDYAEPESDDAVQAESDAPVEIAETEADEKEAAGTDAAEMDAEEPSPAHDDAVAEHDLDIDSPPLAPAELDADAVADDDDIVAIRVAAEDDAQDDDLIVAVKEKA